MYEECSFSSICTYLDFIWIQECSVYIYIYVLKYIYIYIYTFLHIYTYIHIQSYIIYIYIDLKELFFNLPFRWVHRSDTFGGSICFSVEDK